MAASPALSAWRSLIDQIGATVLGKRRVVIGAAAGLFLAQAHGFELGFGHAQCDQRAANRLGPPLAEREVVLAAAALVGIALDHDFLRAVAGQVLRMGIEGRAVLILDGEAVEVEIDTAPGQRVFRVLERILGIECDLRDRTRAAGGIGRCAACACARGSAAIGRDVRAVFNRRRIIEFDR